MPAEIFVSAAGPTLTILSPSMTMDCPVSMLPVLTSSRCPARTTTRCGAAVVGDWPSSQPVVNSRKNIKRHICLQIIWFLWKKVSSTIAKSETEGEEQSQFGRKKCEAHL